MSAEIGTIVYKRDSFKVTPHQILQILLSLLIIYLIDLIASLYTAIIHMCINVGTIKKKL